ncbi:hypothetical protein ILUMI_23520 [Ignelater luminosus]|uniref:Uncharacterized protein n=1 Tax=Ignelater luminosus TaxID=2038154 RepID=A0A8K0CCA8_IGNLU|nr:hypothetical protein ILUMI_23520 [Ignelater luminosus]
MVSANQGMKLTRDTRIEPTRFINYLGVILDKHGTYDHHVTVVAKLARLMLNVKEPSSGRRAIGKSPKVGLAEGKLGIPNNTDGGTPGDHWCDLPGPASDDAKICVRSGGKGQIQTDDTEITTADESPQNTGIWTKRSTLIAQKSNTDKSKIFLNVANEKRYASNSPWSSQMGSTDYALTNGDCSDEEPFRKCLWSPAVRKSVHLLRKPEDLIQAAIVVANPNHDILFYAERATLTLVIATIKLRGSALRIANAYGLPSQAIEPYLEKIADTARYENLATPGTTKIGQATTHTAKDVTTVKSALSYDMELPVETPQPGHENHRRRVQYCPGRNSLDFSRNGKQREKGPHVQNSEENRASEVSKKSGPNQIKSPSFHRHHSGEDFTTATGSS